MSKIYFIADTHFYHTNIIKYCNRPFNSVDEMNKVIIDNWNNVVGVDDIVYHLGDITLHNNNLKELIEKLNGTIYLVRGNHDGKSKSYYEKMGFKVIPTQTKLTDYKFILSHRPLDDSQIPNGYINIHGHIHNSPLEAVFDASKHRCVSVERINYTPIKIEDINNLKEDIS